MTTGQKIAAERKKAGLTQEQLADEMQVSRQAVSRWESDLAFPETDKLVKLARRFGCTTDYLLMPDASPDSAQITAEGEPTGVWTLTAGRLRYEYRSKTTVFGVPLVHISWGTGKTAKGIIAIGVRAKGVLALGIFAMGVFSFGVFALGIFAFAAFALAIASFGSVSVALFSAGAVAVGVATSGAVAVGCFSSGALAVGQFIAVGDVAYGGIALAKTSAHGSVYSLVVAQGQSLESFLPEIVEQINATVPAALRWLAHSTLSIGSVMLP